MYRIFYQNSQRGPQLQNRERERAHVDDEKVTGIESGTSCWNFSFTRIRSVLRNARKELSSKSYYIVVDLAKADFKEKPQKRRLKEQVQGLYPRNIKA